MIRTDWLLRQLDLPPGPWPVSHRALLGFAPTDAVAADEVERRVVERMNLLRVHQLREPDTVTEGMNRLAAAMVALTSPPPAAVPAPPVLPPVLPDVVPALVPGVPRAMNFGPADLIEPYAFRATPVVVPVSTSPEPVSPPRAASRQVRRARSRRDWYVRLAELRLPLGPLTVMRTWVISRFSVEARGVTVPAFVDAVDQLRVYLPQFADLIGSRGRPGELVAAVLQSPADGAEVRQRFLARSSEIIDELREMQFAIEREMAAIRQRLNYGRDRGFWRVWARPAVRKCLRYPEIVCVAVGGAALAVAVLRM